MAGNQTITVLEADGVTQTDVEILGMNRQATTASKSVAHSTEDKAVHDAIAASLVTIDGRVDGLETLVTSTNTKLDTVIASLSVMDDWDSTDKAKVQVTASGGTEVVFNANGQATMANSAPVAIASNQSSIKGVNGGSEYETVAASQTAQTLGATGATGDYLSHVIITPATTSPGLVTMLDNAISIPLFVGGASSVSNLVPFTVAIGLISVSGAWKITTGANVSVVAAGDFT